MTHPRRRAFVAIALALPLGLAACGGSAESSDAGMTSSPSSAASSSTTTDDMTDMAAEPFGAGCAAVPKDGKGSFAGMATDPVATAASNNPVLSTLVSAVGEAGLARRSTPPRTSPCSPRRTTPSRRCPRRPSTRR